MDKYSKLITPITPNYVTYYRHGKFNSQSFMVRYNPKNEVDLVVSMEKRINSKGDWVVSKSEGNCSKEEFEHELNKVIDFLKNK